MDSERILKIDSAKLDMFGININPNSSEMERGILAPDASDEFPRCEPSHRHLPGEGQKGRRPMRSATTSAPC